MDEPIANRWTGKSVEDVLAESFHEIRNPISLAAGYLSVLKSSNRLSLTDEQIQHYIELAFNHASRAQTIVDAVYQYMNEKRKD